MQMKKLVLLSACIPALTFANNYGTFGSQLVFGASSPGDGAFTTSNPASLRDVTPAGDLGFGVLSSLGTSVQQKGTGDLLDVAEDLQNQIDSMMTSIEGLDTATDTSAAISDILDSVNTLESSISDAFQMADENLKVRAEATVSAPLFPIRVGTKKLGSFSLGVDVYAGSEVQLLSGPVSLNLDTDTLLGLADSSSTMETADLLDLLSTTSSLYVKSAEVTDVTLDWAHNVYTLPGNTSVNVGVRLHNQMMNLSKSVTPAKPLVVGLLDEANSDAAIEELTTNLSERHIPDPANFQYVFSADLGAQLVNKFYSLGVTLDHAVSTGAEYNVLGVCAGLTGQALDECYYAEYFAGTGRIATNETHKQMPVARVDAGVRLWKNQIAFVTAYDLWAENDLFGQQHQNLSAAMSFQPNFFLIPDLRLGMTKDMLNDGVYGAAAGLSLLSVLHLDANIDFDTTDMDLETEAGMLKFLRGAGVNLGLDIQF